MLQVVEERLLNIFCLFLNGNGIDRLFLKHNFCQRELRPILSSNRSIFISLSLPIMLRRLNQSLPYQQPLLPSQWMSGHQSFETIHRFLNLTPDFHSMTRQAIIQSRFQYDLRLVRLSLSLSIRIEYFLCKIGLPCVGNHLSSTLLSFGLHPLANDWTDSYDSHLERGR